MRTRRGAVGMALAVALLSPLAWSQQPAPTAPAQLPARKASFSWNDQGTILRVAVKYRDVVDANVERKLLSGLPTVIVMRAYLYPDGANTAVAGTLKSCRIVFDVWEEVYRVQISQPGTGGEKTEAAPNLEGVLRRCAEAKDLQLADRTTLQPNTSYFLAAVVDVNPISKEMMDRIRRWVSRPPGASSSPGDSLFGSFVGLFVARIDKTDRTISFRTQSMVP
ncbi:MAG: hypothetical protein HY898_28265 [Deltaproteobacteria bacterium]|nr:hypothetical protein [Deltaproteobacteria bacterium]